MDKKKLKIKVVMAWNPGIVGTADKQPSVRIVTGRLHTCKLKNVCVPGLNCYSCPGATGACPIGSLQAVVGKLEF